MSVEGRKLTKEGYIVYGTSFFIGILIFLVLLVPAVIVLCLGIGLIVNVRRRQNQIHSFNSFVDNKWNNELQANYVREFRKSTFSVEHDLSGDRNWKAVGMNISHVPFFDVEELSTSEDNPSLVEFSPVFISARIVYKDEEWDVEKGSSFRISVDEKKTRTVELSLMKYLEYECPCVNKCYDEQCDPPPGECRPTNCVKICDTCKEYSKLSRPCYHYNHDDIYSPLKPCFGVTNFYSQTEKLQSQDIVINFELRFDNDPDMYFWKLSSNSGELDVPQSVKLSQSAYFFAVGVPLAVVDISAVVIVIALILCTIYHREYLKEKFSDLKKKIRKFQSLDVVVTALEESGLESSNLILGVDFTSSNYKQGRKTFDGKCLHHVEDDEFNPYQDVISIMGRTLQNFGREDGAIPCYGFGDVNTRDYGVFPFMEDPETKAELPIYGYNAVLNSYNNLVDFCGPTSFAPIINKAIELINTSPTMQYHILVIICDGEVNCEAPTAEAIKRATNYPLSIICVGVGDGPFQLMKKFANRLKRKFDNFSFVNYNEIVSRALKNDVNKDIVFSIFALNEIPHQYSCIKKYNLLGVTSSQHV